MEFQGPVDANVAAQADIIDRWVRRRFDAITVSANDPNALAPSMKRAMAAGIKVSTFDADVTPDAREVFLNQATFAGMGKTMVEMMADSGATQGKFLIVTAVLTAPNQNRWIKEIKEYAAKHFPKMEFAATLPGNEDLEQSKNVALNYLRANPDTKGIFCVTGIATPGVVEAVKQLDLVGKVRVTGLGVPSLIRPYLKDGVLEGGRAVESSRYRIWGDLYSQSADRWDAEALVRRGRSGAVGETQVHFERYGAAWRANDLHQGECGPVHVLSNRAIDHISETASR